MTEPRYTLAEAQAELARQECVNHGHSYDVLDVRTYSDTDGGHPLHVHCTKCETTWDVTATPDKATTPDDENQPARCADCGSTRISHERPGGRLYCTPCANNNPWPTHPRNPRAGEEAAGR